MLAPGTLIAGRYRLKRKLGEGGMGTIWEAHNESINRAFAIKVLLPSMARDPAIVQRFLQEAKAAGSLRHPSIAEVYDMGFEEIDGERMPFIVMELLHGEPFDVVLQRERVVSLELAVMIGKACARALGAAHDAGIIHRDVKPANVFLHTNAEGVMVPKLLDFGISRFLDQGGESLTVTGVIVGTPVYMSPEQFRGDESIDGRSDIWSLGVMLCRAVAGRTPFRGRRADVLAGEITSEQPVTLEALELPHTLAPIIERCLQKEPGARFERAADVADALERMNEPTEAMATSVAKPAPKRSYAAIAVGAVIVLGAVGATWAALSRSPPAKTATAPTTVVAESATTTSALATVSTPPAATPTTVATTTPSSSSAPSRAARRAPPAGATATATSHNAWREPGF